MESVCDILCIRQKIIDSSHLRFEFYNYILSACILAAIGLIQDQILIVVASMLISPVMSFVLALSFGLYIWDLQLIRRGLRGISISFFISLTVGIIFGLLFEGLDYEPTQEMLNRTTSKNMLWGIMVAIFSGFPLASSIIEKNINNMVGVAISTSILPPCVNFGIFLTSGLLMSIPDHVAKAFISLGTSVINILMLIQSTLFIFGMYQYYPSKQRHWFNELPKMRSMDLKHAMQSFKVEEFQNVVLPENYENLDLAQFRKPI
ncbi:MAG: hypothetical protein CMM15_07485 [Rhodospirillaceae bacterium]|nr:hypothetical protein [Rhodospirillaceae bacterium]